MIGYVTLGTNDLARAAPFYDAIAKELGVGRMGASDRLIIWGTPGGAAGIGLTLPNGGDRHGRHHTIQPGIQSRHEPGQEGGPARTGVHHR